MMMLLLLSSHRYHRWYIIIIIIIAIIFILTTTRMLSWCCSCRRRRRACRHSHYHWCVVTFLVVDVVNMRSHDYYCLLLFFLLSSFSILCSNDSDPDFIVKKRSFVIITCIVYSCVSWTNLQYSFFVVLWWFDSIRFILVSPLWLLWRTYIYLNNKKKMLLSFIGVFMLWDARIDLSEKI